jgi:hypothetical protein
MSLVTNKESILNLAMTRQKEIIRKEFTQEELNEMRTTVTKTFFEINDLEDEFAVVKESFKGKIKPLEKENAIVLKQIRNGFVDQNVEVYLVPDYDNKIVEFYDEEGNKVGDRKMMMSELQGRLNMK